MTTTRREFLLLTGATASLAMLGATARAQEGRGLDGIAPSSRKLNILFLGGTGFIGPHQVEYAIARGHQVTLFNRGKRNPQLFPDLDRRQGDRETNDYASLAGGTWDAVIDNSAHKPRWIAQAAAALRGRVGQYLFISSTGVYFPYAKEGIDEDGALATTDDPEPPAITGDNFGGLKVLCEQETLRQFPGRGTVIRPHLIVGPGDGSDRFTYWPDRIARGGEVLAPGHPDDPVQWIDARDLAAFCVHALEQGQVGVFNAAGPYARCGVAELLHGIRATVSNEISFTWADRVFLAEHGIGGWMDLTVWIPPEGGYTGMCAIDSRKAVAAGLAFRPLADTARDTLAWWQQQDDARREKRRAGLSADREREILAAWHARSRR
jgi:2'-hydroxyisoflavone reductase